MRICASLSSQADVDIKVPADLTEVRLDLFDKVPEGISGPMLITYRGDVDLSVLPKDFNGMIDIEENKRPKTDLEVICSHHDHEGTPDPDDGLMVLKDLDCDIVKGAFMVNSFKDLMSIKKMADSVKKRHVIFGMGPLGTVTRIRQQILGNEFTFGYVGEPTAPGQLSVREMRSLGDDCTITGLVGNPLSRSLSKKMHDAAFKDLGLNGTYLPFEVSELDGIEDTIKAYDIRGLNVTIPYKVSIMEHLDSIDDIASSIGAVNTIINDNGKLRGTNTDALGLGMAFDRAGVDMGSKKVLVMGSGGTARTCTHTFMEHGSDVTVIGRNRETVEELSRQMGCEMTEDRDVSKYDIILNTTPVGMYGDGEYPADINGLKHNQAVFDAVYGKETQLNSLANERGCRIAKGEDMLVGQGIRSFEMWTGRMPNFERTKKVIF